MLCKSICVALAFGFGSLTALVCGAEDKFIDLAHATVVVQAGDRAPAERMAATVLVEELEKRTGIRLAVTDVWPARAENVIALTTTVGRFSGEVPILDPSVRDRVTEKEGFSIRIAPSSTAIKSVVLVTGADGRGVLFGVGRLLRELRWGPDLLKLDSSFQIAASGPASPIRGHQLGYRDRANSYDAWTPAQYEQHIRELIIFGANCVENIPFQDTHPAAYMPVSRQEMNAAIGEICARYDIDHWVWTPVDFPATDPEKVAQALQDHEEFYRSCKRLDAIFVPGGDPGDNAARDLIPVLEKLAALLIKHHPQAKVWLSLQHFNSQDVDYFYAYLGERKPAWLGGVAMGPGSPPLAETRARLPRQYGLRWYPDITHTVRCQFSVPWWDPAFAMTLGREPMNPRPMAYAAILRQQIGYTDGFLTYSDGMNDDVNKHVWSMLGWDPQRNVPDILVEYARFFLGPELEFQGADGVLALEHNWIGSAAENGSIDGTLGLWQDLEWRFPRLKGNWRFELHLMRAYYDAYTRERLLYETDLEHQALRELARAKQVGTEQAMQGALAILNRSVSEPCRPEWYARLNSLAESLFKTIGYQTRTTDRPNERGLVLDCVDAPLNNRWWLEDEFAKIRTLPSEDEKCARLDVLRTWENPGEGSFYDEVGHVGKSPRVVTVPAKPFDPDLLKLPNPQHSGKSRLRLSWQHFLRWPLAVEYEGLDPNARYVIRLTGKGALAFLRADGVSLKPTRSATEIGEFQEFDVPADSLADRKLRFTWDEIDESHLNWRVHSHVAEVWLLKQP